MTINILALLVGFCIGVITVYVMELLINVRVTRIGEGIEEGIRKGTRSND